MAIVWFKHSEDNKTDYYSWYSQYISFTANTAKTISLTIPQDLRFDSSDFAGVYIDVFYNGPTLTIKGSGSQSPTQISTANGGWVYVQKQQLTSTYSVTLTSTVNTSMTIYYTIGVGYTIPSVPSSGTIIDDIYGLKNAQLLNGIYNISTLSSRPPNIKPGDIIKTGNYGPLGATTDFGGTYNKIKVSDAQYIYNWLNNNETRCIYNGTMVMG